MVDRLLPFCAYESLLQACLDAPTDYSPQLALADLLAKANDPRAPLLRVTERLSQHYVSNASVQIHPPWTGDSHFPTLLLNRFRRHGRRSRERLGVGRLLAIAHIRYWLEGCGAVDVSEKNRRAIAQFQAFRTLRQLELYACRIPYYPDQTVRLSTDIRYDSYVASWFPRIVLWLTRAAPLTAISRSSCVVANCGIGTGGSSTYRMRSMQLTAATGQFVPVLDACGYDPAALVCAEQNEERIAWQRRAPEHRRSRPLETLALR